MRPAFLAKSSTLIVFSSFFLLPVFSQVTIIAYGSSWKYLDNNTRPANWQTAGYDDALWASGPSPLGYGDAPATTVSFGPDASSKYITTYFRKTVNIADPSIYSGFTFNIIRDDGIVVYMNGTEVIRNNLPAAPAVISHSTTASTAISGAQETALNTFAVGTGTFVAGNNTIAIEVHQSAGNSSDLNLQLQLIGNIPGAVSLTRGPYLQVGNQTALTIRWRTDMASDSRVELGTTFGAYTITTDSNAITTEHQVRVSGLNPDTKYFYRIGSTTQILQGAADNFFVTATAPGTRKLRIAAFGDCGNNSNAFQTQSLASYRNYLTANGIDAADAMMLLGDNAYTNGTDLEYTNNFFSAYGPNILKNHKLYPAPGNHEYANSAARQLDHNIAYYSIFDVPTNGECGGQPSGTKAFYSFDIGDVHFLSLDSYGWEQPGNTRLYDTLGPQVSWVKNDLQANTRKWVVAYWHHPPYTKGSHNSDTESELINIRENFIRILERYGVDMIICGHSHDYERSYLLKGYYKINAADPPLNEAGFNFLNHVASGSSGKYDGSVNSCPYVYSFGKTQHGTVYVVSGSAGADGGVQSGYPHNALPFAQDDGGMFYFEVEENRLDAKFIRRDGVIADRFTIMHDVNRTDTFFIVSGDPIQLSASWPGNYIWNTAASTRMITVTPPEGFSNYSVTDSEECLADSFRVHASICTGSINTWVGNLNDAWENALNWSCGTVPSENTDVYIGPGTPFAPVVSSVVKVKTLTIKPGAGVTVKSGFRLEVSNSP